MIEYNVGMYARQHCNVCNNVPTGKTQNILLLLAHMKIAACWDEFTSLSARIRLEYKILSEDTRFHLDQLSVILFGCSGVEIIESGLPVFSGLLSRGGLKLDLPRPGLGLIWAMFVKCSGLSKDDIWTSKASEMFIGSQSTVTISQHIWALQNLLRTWLL